MVISVDTGNKMIKTEHYEFNSGIDVLDTIPGENDEVIEFGGKYYRTTNRRISYMEDKTEDDRYYILTLIAIAKELDTMRSGRFPSRRPAPPPAPPRTAASPRA